MNWTTQVNCRRGRFPQKLLFRKIFVTFVIGNRLLPSSHSLSIDRDLFCLVVSRVPLFTGIPTLTNVSNFTNVSLFTNMQNISSVSFKAYFLKVYLIKDQKAYFLKVCFLICASVSQIYNFFHKYITFSQLYNFFTNVPLFTIEPDFIIWQIFAKHARFCEGKHSF